MSHDADGGIADSSGAWLGNRPMETRADAELLLSCLGNVDPRESCVRAIAHLIYYAGVRPAEACRLKVEDIELSPVASIRQGDGSDRRGEAPGVTPLPPLCVRAIEDWLRHRDAQGWSRSPYLFCWSRDQISPHAFGGYLNSLARKQLKMRNVWPGGLWRFGRLGPGE